MTDETTNSSASRESAPAPKNNAGLLIGGLIAATAPAWLFAIAAGTAGPRTATLIFGLPVLISTGLAIWASLALKRRGSRGAALTVGIIALVVGAAMYVAWAYLAGLGILYGDGPF